MKKPASWWAALDLIGITIAVCGGSDHGAGRNISKMRSKVFDLHRSFGTCCPCEGPLGVPGKLSNSINAGAASAPGISRLRPQAVHSF